MVSNTRNEVREPRLTIELVPQSSWYTNVRSNVPKSTWDKLRKSCYAQADHRCEVCGGVGSRWPVEAHEVWLYENPKQILVRLIALCPSCHEVKHFCLANVRGGTEIALEHFAKVNGWDMRKDYVFEQFDVWKERSELEWGLHISYLENLGVRLS